MTNHLSFRNSFILAGTFTIFQVDQKLPFAILIKFFCIKIIPIQPFPPGIDLPKDNIKSICIFLDNPYYSLFI